MLGSLNLYLRGKCKSQCKEILIVGTTVTMSIEPQLQGAQGRDKMTYTQNEAGNKRRPEELEVRPPKRVLRSKTLWSAQGIGGEPANRSFNKEHVFGEAGNIKDITIREPHDVRDPKKCTTTYKLISKKLHALVEYNTVEAAEKVVATLNNKQDWRYGLRSKRGAVLKYWNQLDMRRITIQVNNTKIHTMMRMWIMRQKYHVTNGHGHGTQFLSHGKEPSKLPPRSRMPDGTRGFVMGRGWPLADSSALLMDFRNKWWWIASMEKEEKEWRSEAEVVRLAMTDWVEFSGCTSALGRF
ncbi:RNA-binding protein [Striga asiatica]|uniref:RNA-binding protein n=1 Tax=Striga asiatica TaxID=4170 RepID=A0A5A7PWE7_STRAF|nr:RNA-binding protein [Striga asiatica]